ncbi:MAG: hypothetical protein QXG39_07035, partial [Candidatus Aenigmatarchaeota archaeon]
RAVGAGFFLGIFSFLILTSLISLVSLASLANAQIQYGWCSRTIAGKTCQPDVADYECESGFSLSRPSDCYEVYCIDPSGVCMANVPYRTCIEEINGIPATPEADQCVKGCCGVADRMVGITTLAKCKAVATERGFPTDPDAGYLQWYGGLENERECALKFAGLERGCCFLGAGNCVYGYRKECSGTFFPGSDTYCSKIPECNVKSHFKLGCGKMPGDEDSICWFDSAGNQEECLHKCNVPAEICQVCQDESCLEEVNATVKKATALQNVIQGQISATSLPLPYCKNTDCNLSELGESQYYKKGAWGGDVSWRKPGDTNLNAAPGFLESFPPSIPTGHSLCHNFYTGKARGDRPIKTDEGKDFPGRSTGLQNQKLVCNYGRLQVIATGTDRKKLCFEASDNMSAYVLPDTIVPDYSLCFKCGEGTAMLDYIGDMFRGGSRMFGLLFPGYGDLVAVLGNECTKASCEGINYFPNGESWCVFHSETTGGWGMWAWQPIYWDKGRGGAGRPIDAACVPRYPPGTTEYCSQCGGGGDTVYNQCEDKEAWAMGNCAFDEYPFLRKALNAGLLYAYLVNTGFFSAIPNYVIPGAIADCCAKGWDSKQCAADWAALGTDVTYMFKDKNWLVMALQFGGLNVLNLIAPYVPGLK